MITRDQALALDLGDELHYTGPSGKRPHGLPHGCLRLIGPRGGEQYEIVRARVNGACKTWKRRPEAFRLPVKHGLREYAYVTESNAQWWHRASDCTLHVIDQRPVSVTNPKPAPQPKATPAAEAEGCDRCGWTSSAEFPHGCPNPTRKLGVPLPLYQTCELCGRDSAPTETVLFERGQPGLPVCQPCLAHMVVSVDSTGSQYYVKDRPTPTPVSATIGQPVSALAPFADGSEDNPW